MKKIIIPVFALFLCLLAACGNTGVAGSLPEDSPYAALEPVTLIGADSAGQGAAAQLLGEYVAERVAELTYGRLTVDYHPNGNLGGDADLLRQMQANDIQLVICQTAPTVPFIPEMAVFDLPMVFSKYDGDTIDRVLNGDNAFRTALDSAYEDAGLHLMGFLQNATYRLTTANVSLNTLADFSGLQIRTMENSNHIAFWSAIGADPTPLAWAEVYISLQNGMIDAQENAADTCVGASIQEVQNYLCCTNHALYCNQISMSAEAYESLDPLYREALEQAVADAVEYMRPKLAQMDEDSKRQLADGGMTIIEYDNEFFDEILSLEAVQTLYEDIDQNQINGLGTLLVAELKD